MKKPYNVFLFFYVLILIVYFTATTSFAKNNAEITEAILQKTSGKIVEQGLKYELDFKGNGEEKVVSLFSNLPLQRETPDVKVKKDAFQYCIEFKTKNCRGYVQHLKGTESKIVVNLVEEDNFHNIDELKTKLEDVMKAEGLQFKCFEYVKAKTEKKDLNEAKKIVESALIKGGASKASWIGINQGYSVTAYTGKGEQMKMGKELIDINCAIRSYDSGIYVIVGTPVISTCY
ncbi:YwmB family TATA-box binding protein [Clostridium thermarum]|uniref:YwmB family TATA-box binding protein n=1 Tax=Clostridium thermarum TaxID=1716543 RepID=UPI0013D5F6F1|nr:YwmB family TATA-box binding protein [Clostridium thermarum]